jgi:sugar-specific transcriptional regulator TrmB
LSLERVLRTLEGFGLKRLDAEVYVYLAKKGPQKGKDLASTMKLPKNQLYSILKSLQNKGFVNANIERPALFSAVAFEQIIDMIINVKDEEARAIRETRKELLSSWRAITRDKKHADT